MLTNIQVSPVDMQNRKELNICSGDVVRVWQRIIEKNKVRLQAFEGVVIARKHGTESGATFTVRRVGSDGVGVEKIFPLYSPMIDKIEIRRRTKVRRSKLYFLREKTSRQIREKLRRFSAVSLSSASEAEKTKQKVEKEKAIEDAQTEVTASELETKKEEEEVKVEDKKEESSENVGEVASEEKQESKVEEKKEEVSS